LGEGVALLGSALLRGKGADKLPLVSELKVSLCEIYFWDGTGRWEGGCGAVLCCVGKERCGKPKTYTCANILQSKAAASAGWGSCKLMDSLLSHDKGEGSRTAGAGFSLCRAAMAQVIPCLRPWVVEEAQKCFCFRGQIIASRASARSRSSEK
jgi:hypothetical protein